ncbi:CenpB-DNA-bind-domain-containing protein [Ceratobasidium sp. AG-I]|nr:CenpB-DNA-bind-domain-containing protein [Ceratobasidium sp. AG-I]
MPKATPYLPYPLQICEQSVNPYFANGWAHMHSVADPQRSKRQNLTFEQKLQVIEFYWSHRHLSLEQMVPPLRAMGFLTITSTSISRCVQKEAEIREYVAGGSNRLGAKRQTLVRFPEVEAALVEWLKEDSNNGVRPMGDQIREKARHFYQLLGDKNEDPPTFSNGWLEGFRKRNGLSGGSSRGGKAHNCPTCMQPVNHL